MLKTVVSEPRRAQRARQSGLSKEEQVLHRACFSLAQQKKRDNHESCADGEKRYIAAILLASMTSLSKGFFVAQRSVWATEVSEDDDEVGYVSLLTHPAGSKPGVVKKSIELRGVLNEYEGPDLVLDFDAAGVLIGIEILG